jgi:hypothetical protein
MWLCGHFDLGSENLIPVLGTMEDSHFYRQANVFLKVEAHSHLLWGVKNFYEAPEPFPGLWIF